MQTVQKYKIINAIIVRQNDIKYNYHIIILFGNKNRHGIQDSSFNNENIFFLAQLQLYPQFKVVKHS
jgi:hypothetical protein